LVCPNCKKILNTESKFCNECGTKLNWASLTIIKFDIKIGTHHDGFTQNDVFLFFVFNFSRFDFYNAL
jgi:predicted amidophosphoribosyltransferase